MRAAQMQSGQARWTADAIGAKATRTEQMRCADSECGRYGSTNTTIRKCGKRSGKSRVKTGRRLRARPAGHRTGKRRNHIRPRPGNAYNEKMKGVCDRRLSAFSGRPNSPKTAEPLPDIEA